MRILQVVMNMDFGGVESYAVRISRAMVEMGHEVTILTQGGPVEELLRDTGVQLLRENLKQERLPIVAQRISKIGFDIINGHNYNGGRVGQIISDITHIPHVLTVHGPRRFLKRVFFGLWSKRVIALSGADKRGISGLMGISPKRVSSSVYPVDIDKHFPRSANEELRREFQPNPNGKLIVHVSRFSNRKARVAFELIKAMPRILAKEPETKVLIIGSGPAFNKIQRRVERFNETHGEIIHIEPPRLDVSDMFNVATVVIATATTAMEAMACGAVLIAAGRTGYLGLMSLERFDEGQDLLFADHGRCPQQTTADLLACDILEVFEDKTGCKEGALAVAKRMASEFSPEIAAEYLLSIYTTVLQEAGRE